LLPGCIYPANYPSRRSTYKASNLPDVHVIQIHINGFGLIEKLTGLITKKAMRGFTLVRLEFALGSIFLEQEIL